MSVSGVSPFVVPSLYLSEAETEEGTNGPATDEEPKSGIRRAAARCWALLLARIYECLPLRCERCGEPMRIIAFVLDPPVIQRIQQHIDEPTMPPAVAPARSPPQAEIEFDQTGGADDWPELDQTAGATGSTWD